MSYNDIDKRTLFKVGLMTVGTVFLVGVLSVLINDRPFWWRGCQPIHIAVEDATGLKPKSPVRSLGLQIGYLSSVELAQTQVKLGICVTAPVEILPDTKAYVRGEGFLGDKFVELKPVKYTGSSRVGLNSPSSQDRLPASASSPTHLDETTRLIPGEVVPDSKLEGFPGEGASLSVAFRIFATLADQLIPSVHAETRPTRSVPVGETDGDMDKIMQQADKLLGEMTELTKNLKEGLDPQELKSTLRQLNTTLRDASKVMSPSGNLNQSAQRSLEKLESAFDQLNQQMTKINKGEGSVGKLLNDPVYADELLKAAKSLNALLGRAQDVRFVIDVGAEQIPVYDGGRGSFKLKIYPKPDRYYLLGVSIDPRGKRKVTNTITAAGGRETQVRTEQTEQGGILLTGMLGKVFFNRYDLSVGALNGDGAGSIAIYLGPASMPDSVIFRNDIYSRGQGVALNDRIALRVRPLAMFEGLQTVYLQGGLEGVRRVDGKLPYMFGAGVSFDDEDIKLLFTLR